MDVLAAQKWLNETTESYQPRITRQFLTKDDYKPETKARISAQTCITESKENKSTCIHDRGLKTSKVVSRFTNPRNSAKFQQGIEGKRPKTYLSLTSTCSVNFLYVCY